MKCTNCGHENENGAKFCEDCGEVLALRCPNCGEPVKSGQKFCGNCGFKLSQTADVSHLTPTSHRDVPLSPQGRGGMLDALRKAAPKAMADKIRAERGRGEGERKMVTALFTDIVGSTALAEGMDPEDWREVVTGAHRRVSEAVYRYEGTIAQLLGDGVLAFFGAPVAHEDDAERAIRAALDILASMREYAETLKRERSLPSFQMRVGVNTGLVVVGNIGNDLHMEYLAVGDTINLAARMQSAADPGSVFITHNTQRLAAALFDYEDRGRLEVKGKAEPVQTYRVLGERKDASRARGIAGLTSPLVGRDSQLGSLLQLLDGLRAGRGAVVSIIGEAGLGKSRLTAEWRKIGCAGEPPLRWAEGRCLSFTTSVAHHLSTDVLRALCGLPLGASEDDIDAGLRRCLSELGGVSFDDVYPYLAHLLGAKMDEAAEARVKYLDGPALLARHAAAYAAFLKAAARAMPTVIVCEDAHWADPSSVELLSRVVPVAAEAPVLFAFVTRPDRDAPGWTLVADAHETAGVGALEIKLAPLSEADSKQLVSNLLEVEALPDSVRRLILEKAEGNPFFVEEVIRMLIDRGGIVRSPDSGNWIVTGDIQKIEIPDTLHGVLSARIDRLPEEVKRVLQVAAVIGRRFQVKVLERVLEAETEAEAGGR